MRGFLAAFLAALFIGVVGSVAGRAARIPRVSVTIPASVVMIPRPAIYASVYNFALGETALALTRMTDVVLVVLYIGGGLAIARMITDKTWAFAHHIDFNKKLGGTHHPR
ncbi:threonine/serine exporter family protein [Corynebacterium sp. MSK041]|uniref:threonine/serine exporter family protein n=1 Tax=Corynebacterium sp. MSK041 TaxID=3050194 RepID=UPI00254EFD66|nr:threonine/serine exporter family protein [Corynebacterium sp. MSK041]MDK8794286.1 threonine/serine exporter family protein [Corynebacterium sp. MSK041]